MSDELLSSGSHATYPAQGMSTIYVVGWPGEVEKDSLRNPLPGQIVAHTPASDQMLTFRPAGLGGLQLNATNFHAPDASLLLTLYVPEDVTVQRRNDANGPSSQY